MVRRIYPAKLLQYDHQSLPRWPAGAAPCPRCGNNERMDQGSIDGMVWSYQCRDCGWIGGSDWWPNVATWNADVRRARRASYA